VTLTRRGASATGSYSGSEGGASSTTTLDISESASQLLSSCGSKAGLNALTISERTTMLGSARSDPDARTAVRAQENPHQVGHPGGRLPVGGLFWRTPGGAPREASNSEKFAP